jgi:DNA-binding response OmpR family regulator
MKKGRIVVIAGDDWIARLLEDGLSAADYDVIVAGQAGDGFRKACESGPDCVICDVDLPDHDGHWVARSIRAHPSAIAKVPLLFLSNADDERAPLGAFEGGADAHLSKPFRLEEVVAQVAALLEMTKRLREKPAAPKVLPPTPQPNPAPLAGEALRGSLEQMSVATVMSLLELERRTGQLRVTNGGADATIDLIGGFAITSTLRGVATPLLATTRELLNWNKGLVSFYVGKDAPVPDKKRPIGALLMEAAQLNAQGGPTPPPSASRVASKPTSSLTAKAPPKPSKS